MTRLENWMIRKVKAELILSLRQKVLRPFASIEQCRFPEDLNHEGFHLGLFLEEESETPISIGSFHPEKSPILESSLGVFKLSYRLRGMATDPEFAGKGYGGKLLNHGEKILREKGVDFLWFNARKIAYRFYKKLGYEFFGDEFDIPGIGPHKIMYKAIGPS